VRSGSFNSTGEFAAGLQPFNPTNKLEGMFWLVWNPKGNGTGPKVVHKSYEDAKLACQHLIEKKGVEEVFIMRRDGRAYTPSRVVFEK